MPVVGDYREPGVVASPGYEGEGVDGGEGGAVVGLGEGGFGGEERKKKRYEFFHPVFFSSLLFFSVSSPIAPLLLFLPPLLPHLPAEQREPSLVVGVIAPGRRTIELRSGLAPDLRQKRLVVDEDAVDAVLPLGVEEADAVISNRDVNAAVPGLGVLVVAVFVGLVGLVGEEEGRELVGVEREREKERDKRKKVFLKAKETRASESRPIDR